MINVPVLVLVDKLLAKVKMAIVLGARYALSAIWAKCSCLALSISFTCILFVVANMGLLCSSAFLILSFSLSNKDFPFLFFFSLFRFHFLLFFSLFRFLFFIFFSLFRFPSFIVFSLFRFPSFIFFSLFRFPFAIWLANMGVVCIGWWALHTADSIMLSDALLQLRVLMLKKRGGREEGGGGSRDANAMFDLCQMHLCQYTCQNAQLFSQTLLVNINEGQALSKWIVTIPSLANSWKPLKTFASAAKTPGPAPAIVGVLGTAPHISLKQLWLIWPSEKPKPSKDMICLLSSLYFLKIFIVIANLIVISGVSVSIEWQSDLSSHIFSPEDPTLGKG